KKSNEKRRVNRNRAETIRVVWITPLRALAADTVSALNEPVDSLKLPWTVERRTSDTSSSLKTKQKNRLPSCLVTTPESLSVLLSHQKCQQQFSKLQMIVLDEWHELMGTKRGVQTELCLARLRQLCPQILTWAISATIGNVEEARETAIGECCERSVVVKAPARRKLSMRSLIPKSIERFPWAGHMGLKSLESVIHAIDQKESSLVFTNTRSQAEKWYSAILHGKPEWAGKMGLHHGSMDRKKRTWVERELDAGNLKCVICTSSLDLGVDFLPVQQVLQIGSPKGIARLLQRAGRSGHYPGGKSELVFVPTHALELVELAAAKKAIRANQIESRIPMSGSLDVLAQHVITLAAGGGFNSDDLFKEVRTTRCFRDLTENQWQWVLDFAIRGGESLRAYPDFRRIRKTEGGMFEIVDDRTARRHRMSIGTITSDREVLVKYMKGGKLGTIEERFVSKLKPGDNFLFAGRTLKLIMMRDMTAWVRRAKGKVAALPRWMGGRLPLSTELSEAVRDELTQAKQGVFYGPEMKSVKPLLMLQAKWSDIPDSDSLLIEQVKTRDGYHTFVYPFEGRLVHEGLAAILAWRMSQLQPISFATTINDYGIELLSPTVPPLEKAIDQGLFSAGQLMNQIEKSMNASELDRRQFRDIARVAGLVQSGFPGQAKSSKQLQASSDMFFDVFREYDPENLLLKLARSEVMEFQLEQVRLASALERLSTTQVNIQFPPKPTPLAFPILIDRLRMKLSSEKVADRIARLTQQYEKEAERFKGKG
ncbi:MAG: ligase-associated DNA damage response DEXH box helicase, partial [Planctomycetota bacterium]